MTDPEIAYRTYIEPVTPEYVERIIERERPDALLPTMGGQTALNVSLALYESGVLAKHHVELIGANARASSVYLRTKGEMEEGVAAAALRAIYILRPSLLRAERQEVRPAERYGNRALEIIEPVMIGPLRKYRAVPTKTLASAMLACAKAAEPGVHIVESDAILDLGAQSLP